MSDTDQVLESVADAEPNEPVVTEAPEEVSEEVAEEPGVVAEEPEPEVVAEEAEPEVVAEEPEPEVVAPEAPAPVTTQEVVQNVQDILSSTETNVSVDNSESNDLENRVKALEERLEKMIGVLKGGWFLDENIISQMCYPTTPPDINDLISGLKGL